MQDVCVSNCSLASVNVEGRKRVSFGTIQHDQLTGQPSMKRYRSIAFFSRLQHRRGTACFSRLWRGHRLLAAIPAICGACVVISKQIDPTSDLAQAKVRPGISILLSDSLDLIRGKRIGLLTNQTGVNEG